MLIRSKQLVTIDIFYYRPDYANLIQEFIWQTEDLVPELQRVHKFLDHWHRNIDAVVQEVLLSVDDRRIASYRSVDAFLKLN
jgi:uncharacterized protein Usg